MPASGADASPAPASDMSATDHGALAAAAESAMADGLLGMAREMALEAFASINAGVRNRAFGALMSAMEADGDAAGMLGVFEKGRAGEVPLPGADDAEFAELRSYWRARALVAAGWCAEAVAELGSLAGSPAGWASPDLAADGMRLQAYALFAQGKAEEAARTLEEGFEGVPEVELDLARILLHLGRAGEVPGLLSNLAANASAPPELSAQARLLTASALAGQAKIAEAAKLLAEAAAQTNVSADARSMALCAKALALSAGGDAAQGREAVAAAEAARRAARSPMLRAECEMALAVAAARAGEDAKAFAAASALAAKMPGSPSAAAAVLEAALACAAGGRDGAALRLLDLAAASFEAPAAETQPARARSLSRLGRHAEAAAACHAAASDSPDAGGRAELMFLAAEEEARAGFLDAASATLQRLLALEPPAGIAAAAALREAEFSEGGDADAAFALFRKAAEKHPGTDEAALALMGAARLAHSAAGAGGDAAERGAFALEAYSQAALSSNASIRASARLGAGLALLRAGDYSAALTNLEAAAAAASAAAASADSPAPPQAGSAVRARALLAKADALLALGEDAAAISAASGLAAPESDSLSRKDAVFWMGRHYFNAGDFAAAKPWLAEFAAGWPDSPSAASALFHAAACDYESGDYEAAAVLAASLCDAQPAGAWTARAFLLRADALCALLKFSEALPFYGAALASGLAPELAESARIRRADCLFTLGSDNALRFAESAAEYSNAWRSASTPEAAAQCAYKIGRSLEKSGARDAALRHYYASIVAPYDALVAAGASAPGADAWHSRAFFAAAELLLSGGGDRAAAAGLLKRVADGRLPGAAEAARRIERLEPLRN